MKFHTGQAILLVVLILCVPAHTRSQSKPVKKVPTSSITGKVTVKGKGTPGIVVGCRVTDFDGQQPSLYRAVTDEEGNYRITNVRPATYHVMPVAPAFVFTGAKTLMVNEGETVGDVDFTLSRGGVITGKVTDVEGRPLIEEQIILLPTEASHFGAYPVVRNVQTDDRGVYRVFGLAEGKYRVAIGQSDDGSHGGRPRKTLYKQTFHPAVTNPAKATVIEVTEGKEITNVDITVGRMLDTFGASGRIVDGDTGRPQAHVKFGIERIAEQGSSFTTSGAAANSQGEFKLENLMPGKYAVFIVPEPNSDIRADSVPFDVVDQDVTGLLIKTSRGASVTGVVVLGGMDNKTTLTALSHMELNAHVQNEVPHRFHNHDSVVNPDGSFRIGGLQAGMVNFSIGSIHRGRFRQLMITRVERDGVLQAGGVQVKAGEHVTGVRIVASYGTGKIRGQVKVENGELPPTAQFSVWLTNMADDPMNPQGSFMPQAEVDSRGNILVDGLVAGTYEVIANVFIPGLRVRSVRQQVNVADGSVAEITLTIDLKSNPGPGNP